MVYFIRHFVFSRRKDQLHYLNYSNRDTSKCAMSKNDSNSHANEWKDVFKLFVLVYKMEIKFAWFFNNFFIVACWKKPRLLFKRWPTINFIVFSQESKLIGEVVIIMNVIFDYLIVCYLNSFVSVNVWIFPSELLWNWFWLCGIRSILFPFGETVFAYWKYKCAY